MSSNRRVSIPTLAFLAIAASAALPAAAEAKGTYFLIELNTGLAESAYDAGPAGLAYGVSLGTTWKFRFAPMTFALLANVVGRNGAIDGYHAGIPFAADRTDLDLYLSERTIIPVWRFMRVYLEIGAGQRRQSQTIRRGAELGTLTAQSNEMLLILAAGIEARVSNTFSIGIRGEVAPLDSDPALSTLAADLAPTNNRTALMAQVGIHF